MPADPEIDDDKSIIMVFKIARRTATVEIHRRSFLETKILRSDGTNITISVHHPKEDTAPQ